MKYMSKDVIKQLFEVFNDIYDNAEKEHDMIIVSHSKSEWIAVNLELVKERLNDGLLNIKK